MTLKEYINKNFAGSQVEFAKFIGKRKQRITEMLRKGYIVDEEENAVYSKRFDLPELPDRAG